MTDQEVAALITDILSGAVNSEMSTVQAISLVLGELEPPPLPEVRDAVAQLTAEAADLPGVAYPGNAAFGGFYAVKAAQRIGQGLQGGTLPDAVLSEQHNFLRHADAQLTRSLGWDVNRGMAERYGNILSWHHLNIAKTHRPSHVLAHGRNYRVDSFPRTTFGALPGMEPNCDCVPGPPIAGAPLLR